MSKGLIRSVTLGIVYKLCFLDMMLESFGYILMNANTHVDLIILDDVGLVIYDLVLMSM